MQSPTTSFLIPAYNAGDFIADTLNSVLDNSREDIEVIVINDGSTDNTVEVARKYSHDRRVRIVTQANGGLPNARNAGIRESTGDFVVFLDADDLFNIGTLDLLLRPMLVHSEVVLSYGNYRRFGSATKGGGSFYGRLLPRPSGDVLKKILQKNFIGAPGVACIRRTAIEAVGPFNENLAMCEDWEYFSRLAAVGRFQFIAVNVLEYRQHAASMSSVKGLMLENYQPFIDAVMRSDWLGKQFDESDRKALGLSQMAHLLAYIGTKRFPSERWSAARYFWQAARTYPPRAGEFLIRFLYTAMRA